ncbi:hypothetical protein BRETT_003538 [Brettanomyces bruxellensis]|uniref:Uncharacterized protein n=1 Tax=Dekkera bruxellensis TaxID=5007 RepID=A0A871R9V5_DEKBR|nr:uncharacterized protein BRETT_003538 [Brettanomyces bruxellensis]QOU19391.1 hypothetical protein BRETT_003538 [Brettanomyces bruxellensis]
MRKRAQRRKGKRALKKVPGAKRKPTKIPSKRRHIAIDVEDSHRSDNITMKKKAHVENEVITSSPHSGQGVRANVSVKKEIWETTEASKINPTTDTSGINLTIEDSMSSESSILSATSIYTHKQSHPSGMLQIYREVQRLEEVQRCFEQKKELCGDRFDPRVKGVPNSHRIQIAQLLRDVCDQIQAVYEQEERLITK